MCSLSPRAQHCLRMSIRVRGSYIYLIHVKGRLLCMTGIHSYSSVLRFVPGSRPLKSRLRKRWTPLSQIGESLVSWISPTLYYQHVNFKHLLFLEIWWARKGVCRYTIRCFSVNGEDVELLSFFCEFLSTSIPSQVPPIRAMPSISICTCSGRFVKKRPPHTPHWLLHGFALFGGAAVWNGQSRAGRQIGRAGRWSSETSPHQVVAWTWRKEKEEKEDWRVQCDINLVGIMFKWQVVFVDVSVCVSESSLL